MTNSLPPPAALRLRVLHSQGKAPTVCSVFPMKLPGSSFFPMDLRYAAASISATAPPLCSHSSTAPPLSSRSATAPPLCSRSATEPRPATPPQRPCQQQLCHGVPASNKPHPSEKSTPVWLAIWRTWAGFANSQLLPDAAAAAPCRALRAESPAERQLFRTDFRFAPSLPQRSACGPLPFTRDMGVHGLCGRVPDSAGNACSLNCCCSDIANLSAHLHRLPTPPTPPPYLRRMRLPLGLGRRCWMQDEAVA